MCMCMCGHGVWMDPSGRTGVRIYTYVHGHVGGPELGEEHDVVDGLSVREEKVGRLVGRGSRPGAVHLHAVLAAQGRLVVGLYEGQVRS